ncbi:F0F1 ATP synthase subunit B' [Roseobacter sp. HKCCA0434]|uniref:F0F1 ATP synthase subunit B' n=1 Tax=Roseobacter sp. HKCCA0434 TaxID=3079297 RepID=UPI002905EC57|nr:F0F1 ATP synthase subunit B' [Roseobacter sp. HKCCA0434]
MATPTVEGAEYESVGMPQLAIETFPSQIVWLLVALAVIYFLFSRIALPRIGATIEERQDAIANDIERAADYRRQADAAEAAYEQALADARTEANRIADATRADIQKEVDAAMADADAQISAQTAESEARIAVIRDEAAAAVEQVAKETAQALVAALTPELADEAAVNAAVESRSRA